LPSLPTRRGLKNKELLLMRADKADRKQVEKAKNR
jgi:hypothetical protein